MLDAISIVLGGFVLLMIGYWLLELHYFLRTLVCLLHAKIFKKRLRILDTSTYSSICLTTDVDILLFHMNNARYLREVDFARTDFYNRTNLWNKIRQKGGLVFQGGTNIRYRRFIRLFQLYHITSEIVYWDQNSIYMEHKFVTKKDHFVRAIVYCKQKVVKCNVEEIMAELLKEHQTTADDDLQYYPNSNNNHSSTRQSIDTTISTVTTITNTNNNNNNNNNNNSNNNNNYNIINSNNRFRGISSKPDCPLEVRLWIESTLVSSTKLRSDSIVPV